MDYNVFKSLTLITNLQDDLGLIFADANKEQSLGVINWFFYADLILKYSILRVNIDRQL